MSPIGITWVLVDHTLVHVSTFAGVPAGRRPVARCPECGARVVLKLGPVNRHHAAHAPNAFCAATNPESALHMDAKHHVGAQLLAAIGRGMPLVVRRTCAGARGQPCDATDERTLAEDWDTVFIEPRLAGTATRPDILLARDTRAIAGIEILVTHAVDAEKVAALTQTGVPWVEVKATHALIEGSTAWTLDQPLAIARDAAEPWRCAVHAAAHRIHAQRVAADRARAVEAERRQVVLRAARVVDVFGPGGRRERYIYRLEEQLYDWQVKELVLRCGTRVVARAPATDRRADKKRAWEDLRFDFDVDVDAAIRSLAAGDPHGGFRDSPMRWATGDSAANIVHEALTDVGSDGTPLATRYPRRWFYNRAQKRWFIPDDMVPVRWDRLDPDPFAAHPAYAGNRARVSERPVPGHAWKTFALANRPTLVGFGVAARTALTLPEVPNVTIMVPKPGRVLALLTGPVSDSELLAASATVEALGADHVWLSHPRDWTSRRASLTWAPAGRDQRGTGVVVVDGQGVYGAEQFAQLFGRGDARVSVKAIWQASAERVAALG